MRQSPASSSRRTASSSTRCRRRFRRRNCRDPQLLRRLGPPNGDRATRTGPRARRGSRLRDDACHTEYVARLDADDLARPRRLERQIAFLDANPAVGLLGSACTVFDEGGVRERWSPPCDPLAVRWRSVLANPLLHSTVAIRRSALVDGNLNYDPALAAAQDYDLWSRTLLHTEAANLRVPARLLPDARRAADAKSPQRAAGDSPGDREQQIEERGAGNRGQRRPDP